MNGTVGHECVGWRLPLLNSVCSLHSRAPPPPPFVYRRQGRITKVLNMKPVETLGMIEEAAGTRMFETKKQAALKTIEKKQTKVDEIDKVRVAPHGYKGNMHLLYY